MAMVTSDNPLTALTLPLVELASDFDRARAHAPCERSLPLTLRHSSSVVKYFEMIILSLVVITVIANSPRLTLKALTAFGAGDPTQRLFFAQHAP